MLFDSGALPHSEEAEPAEPPVVKVEPPVDAKVADKAKDDEPAATKDEPPAKGNDR
jgi:hypothetical protein